MKPRPLLILALLVLASMILTGCGATLQQVRVPVPVECRETVPDRPAMPTETLAPTATLDAFVQASTAEIERRESYELRMRAALVACTTPLSGGAP